MVTWLQGRRKNLEDELGFMEMSHTEWWQHGLPDWRGDTEGLKFMASRSLWDLIYHQKVEWRRWMMGGIFEEGSNIHMPMTRRIVQQMIARAQNYYFGSDPWFAAAPVGVSDTAKAQTATGFLKYKFEKAGVKNNLSMAVLNAFVRGECVQKTRFWADVISYETFQSVAVAGAGGEPLVANDGDYIYSDDHWQAMDGQEVMVLARDAQSESPTAYPEKEFLDAEGELIFEKRKVRRQVNRGSGPESVTVNYRDFLAPLNVPSLSAADCVIHTYDQSATSIVAMFIERLKAQGGWDPAQYPKVMDYLRTAANASAEAKSQAQQPRSELGEAETISTQRGEPIVKVGEYCIRYDANGDGDAEEIFLLLDELTGTPIMYDYLPNVFPDGKRPYHVVRINPVEGRWHGIGMVDVLYQLQKQLDLAINRWDFSLSKAGSVTFWDPERTVEGRDNKNLKLNAGGTYTKMDSKDKAENIVERVQLYEFKGAQLQEIFEVTLQMMTNLGGVANANDNAMAGMDTTKLATGVRNIERSGQEQFGPFLFQLEPGIQSTVESCARLVFWHMDDTEVYHVTENNNLQSITVDASGLRNIDWEFSMELTRYHAEQQAAQASFATATCKDFYSLPPPLQELMAPLYVQQLKAYGVKNPERYVQPMMAPLMPPQGSSPGQAAIGAGASTASPGPPVNL